MKHYIIVIKKEIYETPIALSSLSNTPPWPGNILPLSLTPAILFNFDWYMSPISPKNGIKIPSEIVFQNGYISWIYENEKMLNIKQL